tara:strand:- start:3909 stop:4949 length:1041 start_codon:yes stop_codon:yes gene_type:complete
MAVVLSRIGQKQGAAATWGAGATGLDADRELMLKLGAAEVLDAFETATVFKGKTRERNIRGGKSVAFPITGKLEARYHKPGDVIDGTGNDPSDLNERVISLDALMIADVAVLEVDELMSYFDVRQVYTKELGRALAKEYDMRVARMIHAAATLATEPLAKSSSGEINEGRIGNSVTLGTDYTGGSATRQGKGDELVNAIFDARVAFEKKDVSIDDMYAVFTPEDYYLLTQSSRAINADFGGAGTIADGRTLRVAGIPIFSSNHVDQADYTLKAGDYNSDYAQTGMTKCKGLIFNKEAVGVVTLLSPQLQMTGNEYKVQHQADLFVARQALGMGVLRAESACKIVIP